MGVDAAHGVGLCQLEVLVVYVKEYYKLYLETLPNNLNSDIMSKNYLKLKV